MLGAFFVFTSFQELEIAFQLRALVSLLETPLSRLLSSEGFFFLDPNFLDMDNIEKDVLCRFFFLLVFYVISW